jgi:hypothetical protein
LGTAQQLASLGPSQLSESVVISSQHRRRRDTTRNLGEVVDCTLSISTHILQQFAVTYIISYCSCGLKRCMTDDAYKTLMHALIGSRLDYCNVLYYGVNEGLLSRLQSVQNAAARLVTGMGRREDITPVLRQLQWLPVRQRVRFPLATLVHRSLAGTAPTYLSDQCRLTTSVGVNSLRSTDLRTCVSRHAHNMYLLYNLPTLSESRETCCKRVYERKICYEIHQLSTLFTAVICRNINIVAKLRNACIYATPTVRTDIFRKYFIMYAL